MMASHKCEMWNVFDFSNSANLLIAFTKSLENKRDVEFLLLGG